MRLVAAIALAVGCSSKTATRPDACADLAQKYVAAMTKQLEDRVAISGLSDDVRARIGLNKQALERITPRLRAVLTNRCTDDRWPDSVIACYGKARDAATMRACRHQLPADLQSKLENEELPLLSETVIGYRQRAVTPEIAQLLSELGKLNAQLADAVKQQQTSQTDAERRAAQAKVMDLQQQIRAVNDKLEAARALQP